MKTSVQSITARIFILFSVLTVVFAAAYARGGENGTTFATGGLDLRIDSTAFYNGNPSPSSTWDPKNLIPESDHFFDISDIKPGDWGKTIISLHLKKSGAWACLDFSNLMSDENGMNEPESETDDSGGAEGELADGMEFFAWFDDGDNVFETGEEPLFGTTTQSALDVLDDTTYALSEYGDGSAWREGSTHHVGIAWCAGDISVDLVGGALSCDGSALGNAVQTDSMSIDVTLRVAPSLQDPKFVCDGKGDHHDDDDDDDGGGWDDVCHPWDSSKEKNDDPKEYDDDDHDGGWANPTPYTRPRTLEPIVAHIGARGK